MGATETVIPPESGAPQVPAAERETKPTSYVIFEKQDNGWVKVGKQQARGDLRAVEAYVESKNLEKGTFMAVPERSVRERKIEVQQTTTRKVV